MRATKSQSKSKIMRFITIPIRILGKARDMFVRRMMNCAERGRYGSSLGCPAVSVLPKSFSARASRTDRESDDFRELVRAASVDRILGERMDIKVILREKLFIGQSNVSNSRMKYSKKLNKSSSVGMGRIDEDKTCEFGEDGGVVKLNPNLVYPRSRSYAVQYGRIGF